MPTEVRDRPETESQVASQAWRRERAHRDHRHYREGSIDSTATTTLFSSAIGIVKLAARS
jgi:hypothetical protein